MLKKILIGILIVLILIGSGGFYAYKKLESQFESFIMNEVEKKQAEVAKTLNEKMEAALIEAALAEELVTKENEIARRDDIIKDYFEDVKNKEGLEMISMIPSDNLISEEIDVLPKNNVLDKSNDYSVQTNVETPQKLTPTPISNQQAEVIESKPEIVEKEVVEVIETVQVEPKEEVVYTKEDFERDKDIAMDLALSRLTASQLSRLVDLSSGGFSPEERKEAKEMFYSNFTASEQAWILDIYTKYYTLMSEG